ncbi:MAG: hypothetical protein ACE14L_02645 [Terriglobales bacterium]
MTGANVIALCTSRQRGQQKTPVPVIELVENHGIVGDAHAGPGLRQVSLQAAENIGAMQDLGLDLGGRGCVENITTEGIDLASLPIGSMLAVGDAILQITKIGKECHTRCALHYLAEGCLLPAGRVFAVVVKGGTVRAADSVELLPSHYPAPSAQPVVHITEIRNEYYTAHV